MPPQDDGTDERPKKNSSAVRCRGSKTGPLLKGQGRFAADINFPGQCTCAWCAQPSHTARSRSIDASAALALPGVHAVWTYADVAHIPPIGFRLTGLAALEPYRQTVLAKDVVRYVGEPVAVVFADDPYVAEDAADLVELSIASSAAACWMQANRPVPSTESSAPNRM